ncbi:hypothetical protein [Thermoflavimicrobium daqui]|uniref:Uncharacterized protein n=1 Tax=Thermoflavimicrobium daqui TaxID=2137476 RepID=A0A364K2J9_9BACL|nr:hypothetical protein [Thermoflavimicrobium daqui]RAL22561.1 hypothetical protein DL897_14210 [Thermoflavimicrobium daqui]
MTASFSFNNLAEIYGMRCVGMEFKPNYNMSFSEIRKERWRSIEGFQKGIKPAYYDNLKNLSLDEIQQLESYPHVEVDSDSMIYFQSDTLKNAFLVKLNDLVPFSADYRYCGLKAHGFNRGMKDCVAR